MTRLLRAVALVALLPLAAHAKEATPDSRFTEILTEAPETYGFPGATAAYILSNGSSGAVSVGVSDVEAGAPMTPDTRMLAASIGKTFFGALTLHLENQGTLSRSDRVAVYLGDQPWFSDLPNADDMTIGQLLTHSAGLPDHVYMDGVVGHLVALSNAGDFTPEAAIAHLSGADALFPAGQGWAYSDTGYLILGKALEAATGRDVFDRVSKQFLTPLALTSTIPSNAPRIPGLAVGYTEKDNPLGLPARTADENAVLLWNPAIEWTGGGFASTSADLARWGHALFTGQAMPSPYLDRLLAGVPISPDAPGISYGSGVAIYAETPFGPVYGHGGWIPGYVSSLRHYADHGVTIAFQINSDVGALDGSSDVVPFLEGALAGAILDGS